MALRRFVKAVALAAAVVVSGASAPAVVARLAAGPAARRATPKPARLAAFNREAFQVTSSFSVAQEARRDSVIVLEELTHGLVARLHAANPRLKVLMYQTFIYTNSTALPYAPTADGCTPYTSDASAHPDWFLRDQYGHVMLGQGKPSSYLMDVGNPGYQRACAANAIAVAKREGYDGVFFDAVIGRVDWNLPPGARTPKYPTMASWTRAMRAMVGYAASALHSRGLLIFGNDSQDPTLRVWEDLATPLDGVEDEGWTDGGVGLAQQIAFWPMKLGELKWTQAHHKYMLLHSYSAGEAANTFGLAAMLLASQGYASYSTSNLRGYYTAAWYPEYGQAQRLGRALGPYFHRRGGIYERRFAHGLVVVNPGGRTVRGVALGGLYSGSHLSRVRRVTLPGTSGLILLRAR